MLAVLSSLPVLAAPMSLNPLVLAALRNPLMLAAPMSLDPLVPAVPTDLPVPAALRSLLEEPVVPNSLLEVLAAPGPQPA